MIKTTVLSALEKAINIALKLDANSQSNLAPLKNHTIHVELTDVKFKFYLSITDDQLFVQEHCLGEADLTIKGTLTAFITMATSKDNHLPKEMEIMGSAHLAQQLQQFMHHIAIDWEEHLSRLTGDTIAHQVGEFVRKGTKLLKRQFNELELNVKEYLHEETDVLARREEIEQFCEAVDDLRNGVSRAAARLNS